MSLAPFLRRAVGRSMLADVATALATEGIDVMPLKGVLLAETVYPDGDARPFTDLDVLVPRGTLARAVARLEREGFEARWAARDGTSVTLVKPGMPLSLDVHEQLFPWGLYDLDTAGVFARARLDSRTFEATVRLPDPLDLYAHVLGHAVKSRPTIEPERVHADLAHIAGAHSLDASAVARHLERHGLARAARHALAGAEGPFERAVLAALAPDPMGALLARIDRRYLAQGEIGSARSWLGQHLLDRSLGRAGRSLVRHAFAVATARLGRGP